MDERIHRKLRCIIWRQWKHPYTRAKGMMRRGLKEARAWIPATNGRGPGWNAGAKHMGDAFPNVFFEEHGLVSLLDSLRRIHNTARTAGYGTVRSVV